MAVAPGQTPYSVNGITSNLVPNPVSGTTPMPPAGASSFGNPYGNLPTSNNPYGNLPSAAPTSTTPSNIVTQALGQNISGAPDLTSLTTLVNQLNLQGQQAANAGRIPNDPALEQQSSTNIGSELGGQLPQDVINQLTQQAAERGVATGSPGSDNSNSSLLQALGLNSLNLEQLGQQNLTAADARNPVAPIFNPGSMLLTPAQLGALNNSAANTSLNWLNSVLGSGLGQPQQGTNYGQGPGVPMTLTGFGSAQDNTPAPNWFSNLTGGTPGPVTPPPSGGGVPTQYDPETGAPLQTSPFDTGFPVDVYSGE